VIPGDTGPSALLHVARAVCRRAERSVVALARDGRPEPGCLVYLNRLSDLLFILARAGSTARRARRGR
jgi:cob(I)alamin adenosyltransferase